MTYENEFGKQHIEYFVAEEFMYGGSGNTGGRCKGKNTDIPTDKWENSFKIAKVVDEIRQRAGEPITILSHYRSPAYNDCIGGVSNSQHREATAADITSTKASPRELWQIAQDMREEGFFSGGIGLYGTFVHVDVRGHNADWTG